MLQVCFFLVHFYMQVFLSTFASASTKKELTNVERKSPLAPEEGVRQEINRLLTMEPLRLPSHLPVNDSNENMTDDHSGGQAGINLDAKDAEMTTVAKKNNEIEESMQQIFEDKSGKKQKFQDDEEEEYEEEDVDGDENMTAALRLSLELMQQNSVSDQKTDSTSTFNNLDNHKGDKKSNNKADDQMTNKEDLYIALLIAQEEIGIDDDVPPALIAEPSETNSPRIQRDGLPLMSSSRSSASSSSGEGGPFIWDQIGHADASSFEPLLTNHTLGPQSRLAEDTNEAGSFGPSMASLRSRLGVVEQKLSTLAASSSSSSSASHTPTSSTSSSCSTFSNSSSLMAPFTALSSSVPFPFSLFQQTSRSHQRTPSPASTIPPFFPLFAENIPAPSSLTRQTHYHSNQHHHQHQQELEDGGDDDWRQDAIEQLQFLQATGTPAPHSDSVLMTIMRTPDLEQQRVQTAMDISFAEEAKKEPLPLAKSDLLPRYKPSQLHSTDSPLLLTGSNDDSCTICLSPLMEKTSDDGQQIVDSNFIIKIVPCEHYFHEACLLEWFETKGTCPICRYDLNEEKKMNSFDGSSSTALSSSTSHLMSSSTSSLMSSSLATSTIPSSSTLSATRSELKRPEKKQRFTPSRLYSFMRGGRRPGASTTTSRSSSTNDNGLHSQSIEMRTFVGPSTNSSLTHRSTSINTTSMLSSSTSSASSSLLMSSTTKTEKDSSGENK